MRLLSKILRVGLATEPLAPGGDDVLRLLHEVDARARQLFGRALAIREVDAGSCNGCELEISGLMGPVYDSERFGRSEEHTSELQSQFHLVCRLLLEKKNTPKHY